MITKSMSESRVELAELMMPEHANPAGIVHGGTIMKIIDNAAAIVAARHSRHNVVTASVDRIDFIAPAYIGNVIFAKATLNFVSRTSMEVGVRVEAESLLEGVNVHIASAYLIFVALNENKKPTEVPRLEISNEDEKRRFNDAKLRREIRLEKIRKKKESR